MGNVLTDWLATYYDEVEPMQFYREIFPAGSMQPSGVYVPGVYNGIIVSVTKEKRPDGKTRIKRYTVTDELTAIDEVCRGDDFCLMSPITYAGKERSAENARFLYAVVVDLDYVRIRDGVPYGLSSLMERHVELVGRIPRPTFIVSSGTGLHLYYVLTEKIPLYHDSVKVLQAMKHDLTDLIWHDTICDIKSKQDIQQEGIFQGFRVVGTITKKGTRARAFRTGEPVSIEYLNTFIQADTKPLKPRPKKEHLNLAQAKELYPDWYESRIEHGEDRRGIPFSRRIYDDWKKKIISGATVGHRYWCMAMLAVFAEKCSFYDAKLNPSPVTYEELERDAWSLMDHMENLTNDEGNHFTTDDVMKALEFYNEKWLSYPRRAVSYRSGIVIIPKKRNGRKQADHIRMMNFVRDEINRNTEWRNKDGAPTKQATVEEWQLHHPGGRKADCIRETGLSRPTVYKWWNEGLSESVKA